MSRPDRLLRALLNPWLGGALTVQSPVRESRGAGDPTAGILLMLASMAVFSAGDGMSKGLTAHFNPLEVTWGRYLFHGLFLLPLFVGGLSRGDLATRALRDQVARGVLLFSSSALFIAALSFLPLANANVIGFVAPLLVAALSAPLLGERVGPGRWLAVLVGFAGVVVVIRPGGEAFSLATLLPLLSASLWAVALILTRRLAAVDSAMTTLLFTTVIGVALSSLLVPLVWRPPSAVEWLTMAALGGLSALGQYLLIRAMGAGGASVLAPFQYSQIIWSTAIGYWCFGNLPDGWTAAGAAIIIGSGLWIWRRERRLRAAPTPSGTGNA